MPKTAINFLKMKKGLYMNESRQSRNNLNQPVGFSTSDLGKNMGMPLMVNSKGTDIYDQSPVNATGK